jgi:hypothetical protein
MNIRIIWSTKATIEIPDTRKLETSGANGDIALRKTSWFNIRSAHTTTAKGIKKRMNPFDVHKNDVLVRI